MAATMPGTSGTPPTIGASPARLSRSSSRAIDHLTRSRSSRDQRDGYPTATRHVERLPVPSGRPVQSRARASVPVVRDTAVTARSVTIGGGTYPVVLPSLRDPRLHVAAVIITVHVLGQVALHFRVSIPQILAAILTCAVIEIALTFRASRAF